MSDNTYPYITLEKLEKLSKLQEQAPIPVPTKDELLRILEEKNKDENRPTNRWKIIHKNSP